MFVYQMVVLGVFVIDKMLIGSLLARFFDVPFIATKISVLVLCYIELISVNENVFKLTNIDLIQKFKKLLSGIRNTMNDVDDIRRF